MDEGRIESVRDLKGVELAVATAGEVGFGVAQRLLPVGVASPLVLIGFGEGGGEQLSAVGAEEAFGEEAVEGVQEMCLADPQTLRVTFGHVTGLRCAHVEAEVSAILAEHTPAAEGAEEKRAQRIGAVGLGVGRIGSGVGPGALALLGHALRAHEGLQGDERGVGGLRGPDPVLDRVVLASAGLAGPAVPHHVTGVLGVGQDVTNVGSGPAADSSRRIGRKGRRVEVQSFVEPIGDRLAAEPLDDTPVEDLADDGGTDGVGGEAGLGLAFASAGGDRVRDAVSEITVGRLADVVALDGVFLEASPCLLQHLQDVLLGYALLDAAGEDLGGLLGARPREVDGLIGGQKGNACGFEAVLDERVLRERTWREVVRRARHLGAPWDAVVLGMTVPVLHRMLARVGRCDHLERAEVEQEALTAVTAALYAVDADGSGVGRELFAAADRAVHRLVYAARRRAQRETAPEEASLSRLGHDGDPTASPTLAPEAGRGDAEDEYTVLALAVRARVVNIAEAQLIARTRLEGEPMQHLAIERGVSCRQLYRHRAAAEQHLAAHLRHQLRQA